MLKAICHNQLFIEAIMYKDTRETSHSLDTRIFITLFDAKPKTREINKEYRGYGMQHDKLKITVYKNPFSYFVFTTKTRTCLSLKTSIFIV